MTTTTTTTTTAECPDCGHQMVWRTSLQLFACSAVCGPEGYLAPRDVYLEHDETFTVARDHRGEWVDGAALMIVTNEEG